MKYLLTTLLLILGTAANCLAEETILAIYCQSQDQGAKIYVNHALKGECPADGRVTLFIPPGPTTVEVKKRVDAEHERFFQQQYTAAADRPERIRVSLSKPQLTAEARQARERAAFERDLQAAKQGNLKAMAVMVERYEKGQGVRQNSNQARAWQNRIDETLARKELQKAQAGDIAAMEGMARRYKTGTGVKGSRAEARKWQENATEAKRLAKEREQARQKAARTARQRAKIQAKINAINFTEITDAAMTPPKGDDVITYLTVSPIFTAAGIILDLTSTPIKLTKKNKLTKELEAHAAAWARPNSMVARAYRQQRQSQAEKEASLTIAAR
ncbi:MAG: hypothetical protein ABFR97_02940 [Thermodesulfobacteriota bacterium]